MSSSESEEEIPLTFLPMIQELEDLHSKVTESVRSLREIRRELKRKSVNDFLISLLPTVLENGIKGPQIYDFIIESVELKQIQEKASKKRRIDKNS